MICVYKTSNVAVWRDTQTDEYFVYQGERLRRVCPSIGMAREVAAGL